MHLLRMRLLQLGLERGDALLRGGRRGLLRVGRAGALAGAEGQQNGDGQQEGAGEQEQGRSRTLRPRSPRRGDQIIGALSRAGLQDAVSDLTTT
jgi:hypothetical protein